MDVACKQHDIAYANSKLLEDRHKADEILENRAWEIVKSKDKDVGFGEKAASWFVTTAMKAKRKLGMGVQQQRQQRRRQSRRRRTRQPPRQRPTSFRRDIVKKVTRSLKNSLNDSQLNDTTRKNLAKSSTIALRAARAAIKKSGGRKNFRVPRVIPFEAKSGGVLPLLPLFAGLSALGSLAGGASAIAKTVIDAKNAKKKLGEDQRHHKVLEEIGKKGSGLYLRKNARGGLGLFLKKQLPKNSQ